jgi:hypothetical protein
MSVQVLERTEATVNKKQECRIKNKQTAFKRVKKKEEDKGEEGGGGEKEKG